MDKLEAMKVFSEVAKQGSFTTTANNLSISNAKVTRYVKELEEWLDCRLLQRTTRNISLTPAGEEALTEIKNILDSCNSLKKKVNITDDLPKGTFRLSTNNAILESGISKLISRYLLKYPEVKISLIIDDNCLNLVEHGIDLALRAGSEVDENLIARPLISENTIVCASPCYLKEFGTPSTPNELTKHKTLLCTAFKPVDKWLFKKNDISIEVPLNSLFHSNNMLALKSAAIAGSGITRLPAFLAKPLIKEGKLSPLLKDWKTFELTLWAVYASREHQPSTVRSFIDFLVGNLKKSNK